MYMYRYIYQSLSNTLSYNLYLTPLLTLSTILSSYLPGTYKYLVLRSTKKYVLIDLHHTLNTNNTPNNNTTTSHHNTTLQSHLSHPYLLICTRPDQDETDPSPTINRTSIILTISLLSSGSTQQQKVGWSPHDDPPHSLTPSSPLMYAGEVCICIICKGRQGAGK
ncbi:hypothetical protein P168DRAFT_124029 [Aspergillus campestris IBT 28561]|uniref:Uncharacterized protein n=1 Tax=Aspergillus campestris (strain IBT 28561) TaxID=1392248 RepID=A0A2I1D6E2_ASPC2|nr:uncharacterized protein P168DRAFT_124029 [Aspergillus campestris IBT 28561]PKY05438.1 hypothetical protein P168DRAFT_124029 [Aspergillus campestris IBT 28561]